MNDVTPLAGLMAGLDTGEAGGQLSEVIAARAVQSLAYILKDAIPGSAGAGASIINGRGRRESAGATDPLVLTADRAQYDLGQGPCLTAWAEQRVVAIADLQKETRWPQWTATMAGLHLRSVLSVPLTTEGRRIGAMKVYSPLPAAFDEHSIFLMERLALPAAVMLGNARDRESAQRLSSQLVAALSTRDAISRAQGILMERLTISAQEALEVMLSESKGEDKPLDRVAREIISGMTDQ